MIHQEKTAEMFSAILNVSRHLEATNTGVIHSLIPAGFPTST